MKYLLQIYFTFQYIYQRPFSINIWHTDKFIEPVLLHQILFIGIVWTKSFQHWHKILWGGIYIKKRMTHVYIENLWSFQFKIIQILHRKIRWKRSIEKLVEYCEILLTTWLEKLWLKCGPEVKASVTQV